MPEMLSKTSMWRHITRDARAEWAGDVRILLLSCGISCDSIGPDILGADFLAQLHEDVQVPGGITEDDPAATVVGDFSPPLRLAFPAYHR